MMPLFPIVRGKEAAPISCQLNAEVWLRENPPYAGTIELDTFLQRIRINGQDYSDELLVKIVSQLEDDTLIPWRESHVHSALMHLASQNPRSSLQTWLDSLIWDGTPRLDTFFPDVCGAKEDAYAAACAKVLFLSACARAYQPGCKADVMVVLIGQQGIGKSKAIASLAPDSAWYTDDLPDLHERKAGEGLIGKWLVEFGEFMRINRSTLEVVKAFITRTTDHFRPAYGRIAKDFPRQCIFIGSTNNQHPLNDIQNRRFMPIKCPGTFIDLPSHTRDQLWSEAVHRYKNGESWWLTSHELIAEASARQDDARHIDTWEEILAKDLKDRQAITMVEVFDCLGIKPDRQDKSQQTRLGLVLTTLGFHRKRVRLGTQLTYIYERTND